jgi:hypothetical protein
MEPLGVDLPRHRNFGGEIDTEDRPITAAADIIKNSKWRAVAEEPDVRDGWLTRRLSDPKE